MSSGSKKKESRYTCLSEAKASHSQRMWAEVSSTLKSDKTHCAKNAEFLNVATGDAYSNHCALNAYISYCPVRVKGFSHRYVLLIK
jgi:hypothetical protein